LVDIGARCQPGSVGMRGGSGLRSRNLRLGLHHTSPCPSMFQELAGAIGPRSRTEGRQAPLADGATADDDGRVVMPSVRRPPVLLWSRGGKFCSVFDPPILEAQHCRNCSRYFAEKNNGHSVESVCYASRRMTGEGQSAIGGAPCI
jgi:hypothetical protein